MKRISVPLSVFVAMLAVGVAGGVGVEAASPKKMLSKLNPMNWFDGKDDEATSKEKIDAARKSVSEKPRSSASTATQDPFAQQPYVIAPQAKAPQATAAKEPAPAKKSTASTAPARAPEPRAVASAPAAKAPAPQTQASRAPAPKAPATKASTEPAETSKSVARKTGPAPTKAGNNNQFVEEFDADFARLMDSVRDEPAKKSVAAASKTQEPQFEEKPTEQPASRPATERSTAERPTAERPVAKQTTARKTSAPLLPDLDGFSAPEPRSTARSVASAPTATKSPAKETAALTNTLANKLADKPADEAFDPIAAPAQSASQPGRASLRDPLFEKAKPESADQALIAESRREMQPKFPEAQGSTTVAKKAPTPADALKDPFANGTPLLLPKRSTESIASSKPEAPTQPKAASLLPPVDVSNLIVSNELVPDRKLYSVTRSSLSEPTRPAATKSAPAARSEAVAIATEAPKNEPNEGILIVPAGAGLRAGADRLAPKVTSNRAPSRIVADSGKVQQLSHEEPGKAIEPILPLASMNSASASVGDNAPLLLMPSQSGPKPEISDTNEEPAAPKLNWIEEPEAPRAKRQSSSRWGVMLAILAAVGAATGVMIRKKGLVVASGRESDSSTSENSQA